MPAEIRSNSFYNFLIAYRSESSLGDPTSDVSRDLADDPDAPKGDAELFAYLLKRHVPADVLEDAWLAYLAARA